MRAGIVVREQTGSEVHYELTLAGLELRPVVEALGAWGIAWIGELGDEDLDPSLLLWDMSGEEISAGSAALRSGALQVHGPEALRRTLPNWFRLSRFASLPRTAVQDAS